MSMSYSRYCLLYVYRLRTIYPGWPPNGRIGEFGNLPCWAILQTTGNQNCTTRTNNFYWGCHLSDNVHWNCAKTKSSLNRNRNNCRKSVRTTFAIANNLARILRERMISAGSQLLILFHLGGYTDYYIETKLRLRFACLFLSVGFHWLLNLCQEGWHVSCVRGA